MEKSSLARERAKSLKLMLQLERKSFSLLLIMRVRLGVLRLFLMITLSLLLEMTTRYLHLITLIALLRVKERFMQRENMKKSLKWLRLASQSIMALIRVELLLTISTTAMLLCLTTWERLLSEPRIAWTLS